MKLRCIITLTCALCTSVSMLAQNKYHDLPNGTMVEAMSPNGRWLVGNDSKSNYGVALHSFFYDTQEDTIHWQTSYTRGDWSKAGEIKAVADDGTMVGVTKDLNHMAKLAYTPTPTNIATVWVKGNAIQLPYGTLDTAKITQPHDGTFATGVSNDGKTVIGFMATNNFAQAYPCTWTKDEAGSWNEAPLNLPDGCTQGEANGISSDGSLIVGYVTKNGKNELCYWQNGECNFVDIKAEDSLYLTYGSSYIMDVSPNGKYFSFSLGNKLYARIYDVANKTYCAINPIEKTGRPNNVSVTDNGDAFGIEYVGNPYADENAHTTPFWFQHSSGRTYNLKYFQSIFAPGVSSGTMELPVAASADGNTIAGYTGAYSPKGWYLKVTQSDKEIPAMPSELTASSEELHTVDLSWPSDTIHYSTLTLKAYNVYCNGSLVKTVDKPATTNSVTLTDVTSGYPDYTVEGVYNSSNGEEINSPVSLAVEVAVPDNYNFPLFDEFNSLRENYWTKSSDYGDDLDTDWAASMYNGYQAGYGMSTGATTDARYSHSIVSRPIDATGASKVVCTFMANSRFYNYTPDMVMDSDSVSLEYSFDDKTWTDAHTWTLAEMPSSWGFFTVDLTEPLAGKLFRIRFHKHGVGAAEYYMYFDNLKVGVGDEQPAVTGLIGRKDDKHATIAWKDENGGYTLNYNRQHRASRYTLGDEGEPLIGANKFNGKDLALYHGKYLTAVKTAINHYETRPDTLGIHAAIVVFQGDKLIREQEIDSIDFTKDFVVKLDQPVLIDSTQNMYIGVKVHDYDKWQIPLLYDVSDDCIPGMSDLYSEDNGKTWYSVYDVYSGSTQTSYKANCCWVIKGLVSDTQETTSQNAASAAMVGYNLYHNGLQVNKDYLPADVTNYTDTLYDGKNDFYVVALYENGDQSAKSEVYTIGVGTNIAKPMVNNGQMTIDKDGINLKDGGKATLYTLNGVAVATVRNGRMSLQEIPNGIYILKLDCNGVATSQKIMIRHSR